MQKLIGSLIIASFITFVVVVLIAFGVWSFTRPVQTIETAEPAPSVDAPQIESADLAQLQTIMQSRAATYENQVATLHTTIQERQTTYEAQIMEATQQLEQYRAAIAQYQQNIQMLDEQSSQLEQSLTAREASYQTNIDQAIEPLIQHRQQLHVQLEAAHQALAEANAQLGR